MCKKILQIDVQNIVKTMHCNAQEKQNGVKNILQNSFYKTMCKNILQNNVQEQFAKRCARTLCWRARAEKVFPDWKKLRSRLPQISFGKIVMEIKRNGKNPSKFFSLSKKRLFVNAKNGNCDNTKICLIHRKVPLEEIIHKKVPLEEMTWQLKWSKYFQRGWPHYLK